MNIFNRIIMVILLLSLIVFSIVSIVNIFTDLFKWSDIADRILNFSQNVNPFITALVLFFVLAISLIILIFEFYRRKIKTANISSDQSGKTMLTLKTVSSQIKESLIGMEDISDTRVKIIPKHDGIIINIFSRLAEGVNVTEKTKEVREAASEFASKNLGFKVINTNYTAVGFTPRKVQKLREEKEEKLVEIQEEPETKDQEEKQVE